SRLALCRHGLTALLLRARDAASLCVPAHETSGGAPGHQACFVRRVPASAVVDSVACIRAWRFQPWCESGRTGARHFRAMGIATARHHARDHTAAGLAQCTVARDATADAGVVCLRLCLAPFLDMARLGSRASLAQYPCGHRQTSVHHDRLPGASDASAAGRHLDQCHDASAWQAVENIASLDLPDLRARRLALLLASQSGCARAARVRFATRNPARLARLEAELKAVDCSRHGLPIPFYFTSRCESSTARGRRADRAPS